MVKYPEVEVAAAAIPSVTVDKILGVLSDGYPEGSVTGLEYIFLYSVLCDEPPSLIEPVSKSAPESLPVLTRYLP